MDRRTLIRGAAAAGAGAWVAPTIIDSLASPAGAITVAGCDFYVFKVTRSGGTCTAVIQTTAQCGIAPSAGASGCTSLTRRESTTSPVNFTGTGCSESGGTEVVTFTINTPGRIFAGVAQTGPNVATCPATVTLAAGSGTQTQTVTQTGQNNNASWWAYLAVG